ncbi:hypothetical protein SAMN04489724_1167 [Algoriphagus locisalis]|uniref:Uncharacterized protein n=1 Tax=Algoriphagus locisalis TaxID=305507 RepID=A0A1I6YR72_9BACT|nr:hypothetical protein [Algoriphagus locisalis]SFT52904.1 hypothetical protein SAMN04489724_1167 [Algoriphagus locisalis]
MEIGIRFVCFYLASEVIAYIIFELVRMKYLKNNGSKRPMWNGIIERIFIYLCLISGVYHGLTLFGALKIGTRIKADENKISNDYFLIGNMISVGLVLLTFQLYKYWTIL